MSRRSLGLALFAFVATLLAPAARAQEYHSDAKLGFKIRPPKDFGEVPVPPDEEWVVAHFQCSRAYTQVDKGGTGFIAGMGRELKPEMTVVAFPQEVGNDKGGTEKVETKDDDPAKSSSKSSFKDYKDYLKRTHTDGGYSVAAEDKAEVEGVKVETLEIKVEKRDWGGARRLVTWVYDLGFAKIAVQFEMWETTWAKLKPELVSSFRSFRVIPRDLAGAKGSATKGDKPGDSRPDKAGDKPGKSADDSESWDDLTPAQRTAKKIESMKREHEKVQKGLPQGWTSKKTGHFLVLSHTDDNTVQRIVAEAEGVLSWLDDNLGYIGPGEYVRDPILRVCANQDERNLYSKGGYTWFGLTGLEITTYKDNFGFSGGFDELSNVRRAVFFLWLRERDEHLSNELPWWLRHGFESAFGSARAKDHSLVFAPEVWEHDASRLAARNGKLISAQDLMKMDDSELMKNHGGGGLASRMEDPYYQCGAYVRYLLSGPRKAKDALKSYLLALHQQSSEHWKAAKKTPSQQDPAKPKTEEEEDAAFKAQQNAMHEHEKKDLDTLLQKAFGTWTEADWKSFNTAYLKAAHE